MNSDIVLNRSFVMNVTKLFGKCTNDFLQLLHRRNYSKDEFNKSTFKGKSLFVQGICNFTSYRFRNKALFYRLIVS